MLVLVLLGGVAGAVCVGVGFIVFGVAAGIEG